MSTYLVACDLKQTRINAAYDDIGQTIESLGHSWHCLDTAWIVQCNLPATQICSRLRPLLYDRDELFVAQLGGEFDWIGIDPAAAKWLQKHLV